MVHFTDCQPAPDNAVIAAVERLVGVAFPAPLRELFVSANGGRPHPNSTHKHDLVILECLPLEGGHSARSTYQDLVIGKQIVPRHFFPFAFDLADNVLFVDCTSSEGAVHRFEFEGDGLRNTGLTLRELWVALDEEYGEV